MGLGKELRHISKGIGRYIKTWLLDKEGFECRTFYGETFSLALLGKLGMLDSVTKNKLVDAYKKMNKEDSQFHWEFNNYALLSYAKACDDKEVYELIYPLKFKNTPVTNWTLLRSNARLLAGQEEDKALKEAINKIQKFQLKSGLILDQKHDKSFQYHCFSMAMIAEIYEQTKQKYFYNSFLAGVDFIRKFILSNGDVSYIGRGQKQSFGLGALVYILSLAYKYTLDKTILADLKNVTKLLIKYQNKDGSFPLVLNGIKQSIPKKVDIKDPSYVGWYPYNNYFDYLPFMGFFVLKAANILNSLDVVDTEDIDYQKDNSYADKNFIKINNGKYEAVVSKPGGYWTNDMPIPYIVYKGKNITTCYGGEQFQDSLYSLRGLPLPYCKFLKKSIRWKSINFLKNNTLWVFSPLGVMRRDFIFKDNSIEINTKIYSFFKLVNLYLFKSETKQEQECKLTLDNVDIVSKNALEFKGYEYSVDGKLKLFEDNNKHSYIRFIFK